MSEFIRQELMRANQLSRDKWHCYTPHRRRVTDLIIGAGPVPAPRVCILGAGNSNDIDLQAILAGGAKVDLVDLDAEALTWGVQQQAVAGHPDVRLHTGIDVSGIADVCSTWTDRVPSSDEIDRCLVLARCVPPALPGQSFHVVVSLCLISQLFHAVIQVLGESHPRLLELISAIRLRHVRSLAEMLYAGGTLLLISDLVSSDSYTALSNTPDFELPHLLGRLINARNFFTGLNPAVLVHLLRTAPEVAPLVSSPRVTQPWLWDFGPRTYACFAMAATRTDVPA